MPRNWQNPEHEPILRAVMQIAGNELTARAHAGTGDQPTDVRPVLGWADATDDRNPLSWLSWLRAPSHLRDRKGALEPGCLPHTRAPARGSTGSTRRPWSQYQLAGETARLLVRGLGRRV